MISLGLNQSPFQEPTEEQLRRRLADASKARNLLDNSDFQWWVETLRKGAERHKSKLVYLDEEPARYHKRRGIVQGVEKELDALRILASAIEDIEARLKERYDRQSEPVARRA